MFITLLGNNSIKIIDCIIKFGCVCVLCQFLSIYWFPYFHIFIIHILVAWHYTAFLNHGIFQRYRSQLIMMMIESCLFIASSRPPTYRFSKKQLSRENISRLHNRSNDNLNPITAKYWTVGNIDGTIKMLTVTQKQQHLFIITTN